jgi:hypothetical protein
MTSLLILVLVAAALAAGGMRCLRLLGAAPADPRDDLLVGLVVGLTGLGTGSLVLAALGALSWVPLGVALAAGGLSGAPLLARALGDARCRPGRRDLLPGAVILAVLAAATCAMLAPAVTGDQTKYQLAYPRLYAAAQGLVPTPWSFWGQQQFLANWVFAAGYALHGEPLARLLNGLTGVLAIGAVGRLVERHLLRGAGMTAAMLVATQPMTWSLLTRAGSDLLLVACAGLAMSAFLDWRRGADAGALRRLALLAGAAGGSKVMGMLIPALLGVGVLLRGGRPVRRRLVAALVFGALAGAVAAPPYVRNLVEVGNPLHPFGHSVFDVK